MRIGKNRKNMKARTYVVEISMRKDQEKLGRWRRKIGMCLLETKSRGLWQVYWLAGLSFHVFPTCEGTKLIGVVMTRGIMVLVASLLEGMPGAPSSVLAGPASLSIPS